MRKVYVYIAASLDGFIAKPGDNLDFLNVVQKTGEDYGYAAFIKQVDTVIMGRNTYDWVLRHAEYPHKDKKSYIITHKVEEPSGNITFYSGDLQQLVTTLKAAPGKKIFCDGGATTIHQLLQYKLIDELIVSIIPVLLGGGVRLFNDHIPEQVLELVTAKSFDTGLVQLHYKLV